MKTPTLSLILLISHILVCFQSYAQNDSINNSEEIREMAEVTTSGLSTGIHINKYPMVELGYFKHTTYEFPMTFGSSYTIESNFIDDLIIAPKINYWMNILFINAGFSIPWYFNFDGQNSLKIRPEIGFGYKEFKINYSANLSITNKQMEHIGVHFISLNYYIGLKEK